MRLYGVLGHLIIFRYTSEEDAPYPWKAMANKLDLVEFQEWIDTSRLMETHAKDILELNSSPKDDVDNIVTRLSRGYPTHPYTITFDEAKDIFRDHLHKASEDKYSQIWSVMRMWLRKYIGQESSNHIIRYVVSEKKRTNIKRGRRHEG